MTHQLTITVDDTVYHALKPMVEQETIGALLYNFMLETSVRMEKQTKIQTTPFIASLRGTLHKVDTSDIREKADRTL